MRLKKTPLRERLFRLLMVDDHSCLMKGFLNLLEADHRISVVGQATTLSDATTFLKTKTPDVILLDLELAHGESGFSFIPVARKTSPKTKIIIFSTYNDAIYRQYALEAGADGYLGKDEDFDVVKDRILAIASSKKATGASSPQEKPNKIKTLSNSEKQVFKCLAEGLAQKEIADRLHLSTSTVATYVQRAKEKLGVRSLAPMMSKMAQVLFHEI